MPGGVHSFCRHSLSLWSSDSCAPVGALAFILSNKTTCPPGIIVLQVLARTFIMKTTVSIRLPGALTKNLDDIAKETESPRSFHIQKAIELYIEDFADLRIAIHRLKNHKGEIISSKTLRKSLGL